MKSTDQFKKTILSFIKNKAQIDTLFAPKFENPAKKIDDCITYILNTVKKSGCEGFTDDEIFGMAIHYYDEESIEIGAKIDCKVVVNRSVELTEEDKEEAKKKAVEQYQSEALKSLKKKVVKKETPGIIKLSLFDDDDE